MRKSYRVKSERDFQKVFENGKSYANRQFVVYVLEKPEQLHFRVGISVGKKIGNAVARNWVKRRIRQALTDLKPQLKRDCDFIIIARSSVAGQSMAIIKKHLMHVLRLAQLLPHQSV